MIKLTIFLPVTASVLLECHTTRFIFCCEDFEEDWDDPPDEVLSPHVTVSFFFFPFFLLVCLFDSLLTFTPPRFLQSSQIMYQSPTSPLFP